MIDNNSSFEYTLPEKRDEKIFNSQCIIDFYIPHFWGGVQKFLIHNI